MFRVDRILTGGWDKKSEIAIMLQMSQAPPRYQTLYLLSSIGYLFSIGEKSTPTSTTSPTVPSTTNSKRNLARLTILRLRPKAYP